MQISLKTASGTPGEASPVIEACTAWALRKARVLMTACLVLALAACGGGDYAAVDPLTITAQPVDTSVVAGRAAVFNVSAPSASGYQWQASADSGVTWSDIAGATAAAFTTDVIAADGTRYRVIVTSPSGARTTSSAVRLTVTLAVVAPAITMQPTDQTAVEGQSASFSVTATGTSPAYQWQASADGGVSYASVAGATSATLAMPGLVLADNAKKLRVTVSNGAGASISNPATLSVMALPAAPAFTLQAANASVTAPNPATFRVAAVGNPTPALQWQLSSNAGATFADIAGATSPSFTTPSTSTAQSGALYRAVATNSVAATPSTAAILTVAAMPVAPSFSLQPANASVIAPATATFTVAIGGTPTPTVQWQSSTDGGTIFANVNGATAPAFTTAATTPADDSKRFRAVAGNAAGSLASSSATLTVAATSSVGPAGGTLVFLGGAVTMVFPAGAVATPTTITVQPTTIPQPRYPAAVPGTTYDFGPTGTVFAQPVQVTIVYAPPQVPAGTDPATMQISKSTTAGWNGLTTSVDTTARTVTANLGGFSTYAVVPGLQPFGYGQRPGMAVRYFDWPGVRYTQVATDPAGSVFLAGAKSDFGSADPMVQGGFVARLNSNLSVQWVSVLPNHLGDQPVLLRVDQQGNSYVAYADSQSFPHRIQLMAFTPSGTARTGFPISWSSSQLGFPAGMAIDPIGNVHVFGIESNIVNGNGERIQRGSYTVVRGNGSFATAPTVFTLAAAPSSNTVYGWDMALDFSGNVYFTSSWQSNSAPFFGNYVMSFQADTLVPRPGFPLAQAGATFFGAAANSLAATPLTSLPVTGYGPNGPELAAYNPLAGVLRSGFPVSLAGLPAASYSAVDASGNIWLLGDSRPGGGADKVWIGGFNSSGQVRAGFPLELGGAATTFDYGDHIAADPAGHVYVSGSQTVPPNNDGLSRRVYVAVVPGF